jgi:4-hydroxybenzoyl-CoA thioesterase
MAVVVERGVDFSMIDMANVAYYPRIYDLAHKCFEDAWPLLCGVTYPELVNERRLGFPVVSVTSTFLAPIRYGDAISAEITLTSLGTTSLGWCYEFRRQDRTVVWRSEHMTVCVNMDSMEKQAIPDDLRHDLTQHVEAT